MSDVRKPDPDIIIGIDLGTTNSLVAIADARGPRILASESGDRLLPSVVRFGARGAPEAVGSAARDRAVEFPDRTIHSAKRLMGRRAADASPDAAVLPYTIAAGELGQARIALPDGTLVSPQEVAAWVLRGLKQRAERALGHGVRRAVITVPAYFDDAQRQATRDAGRLAGLEVARIINEPTAAAMAYGIGLRTRAAETIAVFDLGGGTFDITILRVTPAGDAALAEGPGSASRATPSRATPSGATPSRATDFFEVLATAGDTRLGGDDADRLIIDLVLREAKEMLGRELDFGPSQRQALRALAERVKIALSTDDSARIEVNWATEAPAPPGRAFERTLTRAEFESMLGPLVDRAMACCHRALRDAKLAPGDIDRVILVGGSTRIPVVRRRVAEFFGRDPYTALDPDEVVALGAAVQGSALAGAPTGMLLLDVLPLSLGIETVGGAVAKLIVRNATIPARAREMFSTSVDGQTSIKLHIVQGEREMVEDCRSLGVFHLRGLPPMPAGIPQVEVEFLVDANGVLNVSAYERRSGRRANLQVVAGHGLTEAEVARLESEAFAHAREDMTRHRIADLCVNAGLDVKWTRDRLAKVGALLEDAYRDELEAKAAALESLIARARADWKSVDANAFHAAKEALDAASVRMHEVSIAASLRGDAPPPPARPAPGG